MVMGIYFQAQDDYLDCYGTPEQIGKIGTDIQDKKCGWLFCNAYHHIGTPEQKAVLKANYGVWDDAKVGPGGGGGGWGRKGGAWVAINDHCHWAPGGGGEAAVPRHGPGDAVPQV